MSYRKDIVWNELDGKYVMFDRDKKVCTLHSSDFNGWSIEYHDDSFMVAKTFDSPIEAQEVAEQWYLNEPFDGDIETKKEAK